MTEVSNQESHGQQLQDVGESGGMRAILEAIVERLARMERKLDQLSEQPRSTEEREFRGGGVARFPRPEHARFSGHRPGGGYDRKFPSSRYEGRDGRGSYGDRRPRSDRQGPPGESGSNARPDPFAKFRRHSGAPRRDR